MPATYSTTTPYSYTTTSVTTIPRPPPTIPSYTIKYHQLHHHTQHVPPLYDNIKYHHQQTPLPATISDTTANLAIISHGIQPAPPVYITIIHHHQTTSSYTTIMHHPHTSSRAPTLDTIRLHHHLTIIHHHRWNTFVLTGEHLGLTHTQMSDIIRDITSLNINIMHIYCNNVK